MATLIMPSPHQAPNYRPHFIAALLLVVCFACGGASCPRRRPMTGEFAPPVVFTETPTLEALTAHVNRSLAIERIASNTLSITAPEIPGKLSGDLQWERWFNFSFQAYPGSPAFGTALAAGSNSQYFWLKTAANGNSPATLYYASYQDFDSQLGPRRILPVSPIWLREAMGIVELDPTLEHHGPVARPDGKLQVQSVIPSPRGPYLRELVFDARTGVLEETTLKDPSLKLVARALQSQHEYYSAVNTSLPHKVIVQLQPDEGETLSFTIDIGFYMINQPSNELSQAFTFPDTTGLSTVDLVRANAQATAPAPSPPVYRANQASVYPNFIDRLR